MPEVVADTTAIQYLYQCGQLDLLSRLYRAITIPTAVVEELRIGRLLGIPLPDVGEIGWVSVRAPLNAHFLPGATDLGRGEREVLALGAEVSEPLLLLDDALARRYALRLSLRHTGILGILLHAKSQGEISEIRPLISRLDALGFRLDADTKLSVLALAGES